MQHVLSRSKIRIWILINNAAASSPRPSLHLIWLLPDHCSPGNFGNKMEQLYQCPLLPMAQVHVQGKSLLHTAVTGTTASLGKGSSRAFPEALLRKMKHWHFQLPLLELQWFSLLPVRSAIFCEPGARQKIDERKSK